MSFYFNGFIFDFGFFHSFLLFGWVVKFLQGTLHIRVVS